jgi:hypothetical protein
MKLGEKGGFMNTVELRIGWDDFTPQPPPEDRDVDVSLWFNGELYGFVERKNELYIMIQDRWAKFSPQLGKVKSYIWITGPEGVFLRLRYENLWVLVPFLSKEERR